jgi:hypothetical protein
MASCGEMFGVKRRRLVAEPGMRPRRVVVLDPASDHPSRLVEIEEERLVQEFVAHATALGPLSAYHPSCNYIADKYQASRAKAAASMKIWQRPRVLTIEAT